MENGPLSHCHCEANKTTTVLFPSSHPPPPQKKIEFFFFNFCLWATHQCSGFLLSLHPGRIAGGAQERDAGTQPPAPGLLRWPLSGFRKGAVLPNEKKVILHPGVEKPDGGPRISEQGLVSSGSRQGSLPAGSRIDSVGDTCS